MREGRFWGCSQQRPRSSAAAAQTDDWAKVVEAAKKEGKLRDLHRLDRLAVPQEGDQGVRAKYGIKVDLLEARASEVRERVRVEQSAGRFLGDLHHNGSTTTWLMTRDGNFQPRGAIPNVKNIEPPYEADDIQIPAEVISYCVLVNKNMVKPADEPKSWKDLLDPKWAGKILSDDYRALGGGAVFFVVMQNAFGREFHEKLAAQKPSFSRDIQNSERRIARGEFPLYIPFSLQNLNNLKGLPVKAIVPAEGRPYVRFDLTMLKNAPHPNAARAVHEPLSRARLAARLRQRGLQSGDQGRGREDAGGDPAAARDQGDGHDHCPSARTRCSARQADLQVGPDAERHAARGRPAFRRVKAVDGIDLSIEHGEFFTLLGPIGLRQDHDAAHGRGPGEARRRLDRDRRPRGERSPHAACSCRPTSASSAWCSSPTRSGRT